MRGGPAWLANCLARSLPTVVKKALIHSMVGVLKGAIPDARVHLPSNVKTYTNFQSYCLQEQLI